MKTKVSMAYRTDHDLAGRQLFPPQQQNRIIALATKPPRQQVHPVTHWSTTDLSRAAVQKGIVASTCSATIWRLLDQAALKPNRWYYWLNSPDPDFYRRMHDIVESYINTLSTGCNYRIVKVEDGLISFRYRDRTDGDKCNQMTICA